MLLTKEGERTEICWKEKITSWQKTVERVVHCEHSSDVSPSSILDVQREQLIITVDNLCRVFIVIG